MDIRDVIRRLLQDDLGNPERWQASHQVDGKPLPRPTVTAFKAQPVMGGAEFAFTFDEQGASHTLVGTFLLTNQGEQVTLDDAPTDNEDVVVGAKFVFPQGLRGLVGMNFALDGRSHRYRFDTTLFGIG